MNITAINLQTEDKFDLPTSGDGNWMDWLATQGYLIHDRISLGYIALELYCCEGSGIYALYHPSLQGLRTACLFFNIPTEDAAQDLIDLAQQMVVIVESLDLDGAGQVSWIA
ncbi:hypothetical protein GFS31_08030 [Leptolyngbya sp. BL0902]|uniref:hypothetical protein n=1 Tax=Leptolyngbya sp. BL0902 TaxID=1115757 RepID=UPI0018E81C4B|nr:hypothetical protein [Leptolyngbya sp. BL0902]QQE64124.1 hypothetical protein GFS31_08030 [Leptolyngbya sp. BL0902]